VGGDRRNDRRGACDDHAEQRLLKAECGTGARGTSRLRGGGVGEPVPRHAEHAGAEKERDEECERRVDGRGDARGEQSERETDRP
jgi:hypothetical protein